MKESKVKNIISLLKNFFQCPLTLVLLFTTIGADIAWSLPIDWHGALVIDTGLVSTYRRTKSQLVTQDQNTAAGGSQILAKPNGGSNDASYQSYIFRLSPSLIINDSVTVVAETTTGYARGGFFGDSSATSQSVDANTDLVNTAGTPLPSVNQRSLANGMYYYNTHNGAANLSVNKLFMEIYSDTATILIGRQPFDWGLGLIFDSGEKLWSRHSSIQDGISAKFKIGNFFITPYWAKINSTGRVDSSTDVTDFGASLLYDDVERDFAFGILMSNRKSNSADTTQTGTSGALGTTNVKLFDLYLKKSWGKFSFAAEAPFLEGKLGTVYTAGVNSKYKAHALAFETGYKLDEKWKLELKFGRVTGEDGNATEFKALYLHPNYQIANLMFRYNFPAVMLPNANIFDGHMTNTDYIRLAGTYNDDALTITGAFIFAKADQVAKAGRMAFNHETNTQFIATQGQSDEYGYEIDVNALYAWNSNLHLGADAGYHIVGDYYKFVNNATPASPVAKKNSFVVVAKVGVDF